MYLICYKNGRTPVIIENIDSEKEFCFYERYEITVVDLKTNKYLVGTEEDPIHGVISKWEPVPQRHK